MGYQHKTCRVLEERQAVSSLGVPDLLHRFRPTSTSTAALTQSINYRWFMCCSLSLCLSLVWSKLLGYRSLVMRRRQNSRRDLRNSREFERIPPSTHALHIGGK